MRRSHAVNVDRASVDNSADLGCRVSSVGHGHIVMNSHIGADSSLAFCLTESHSFGGPINSEL